MQTGRDALARGDWQRALDAFQAALAYGENPEALEGIGLAAWWLDRADIVFDARERAYRLYRERDDLPAAARVAVWISWDYAAFRGEEAIAGGWLKRADRLLEHHRECPERAWLLVRQAAFALLEHGNLDEADAYALEGITVARAIGSVDFEMIARALKGFVLVTAGRVNEGMPVLDEVNAAVVAGELSDLVAIGLAGCYLIAACERVRDYDRAAQWCDRLKAFCKKWGFTPLFAVCRTQYASLCIWRGAWGEAERELVAATDELAASRPAMTSEGLARLADLRRRQGRLDEAAALFDRAGAHPIAALGRAAVACEKGDFPAAVDFAERILRHAAPHNRTERAAALEVLVRAHVALGQAAQAGQEAEELRAIAADAATLPLRASAAYAAGLIAADAGEADRARRHFEDAVDLFQRSGAPFETARARIELARTLGALRRNDAACLELDRAVALLTPIEAATELARAQAARDQLSAADAASGSASASVADADRAGLTPREVEVLRLISSGMNNQAIAARLFISEHTVHRHVANTLTKLGVSSRSAAVAQAARHGLL